MQHRRIEAGRLESVTMATTPHAHTDTERERGEGTHGEHKAKADETVQQHYVSYS